MTLATSGEEGVSARMVLFKGIEDGAFLFYSNYGSRKGRDLAWYRGAALVCATRGGPLRALGASSASPLKLVADPRDRERDPHALSRAFRESGASGPAERAAGAAR